MTVKMSNKQQAIIVLLRNTSQYRSISSPKQPPYSSRDAARITYQLAITLSWILSSFFPSHFVPVSCAFFVGFDADIKPLLHFGLGCAKLIVWLMQAREWVHGSKGNWKNPMCWCQCSWKDPTSKLTNSNLKDK